MVAKFQRQPDNLLQIAAIDVERRAVDTREHGYRCGRFELHGSAAEQRHVLLRVGGLQFARMQQL
jgi:hypothetical protein